LGSCKCNLVLFLGRHLHGVMSWKSAKGNKSVHNPPQYDHCYDQRPHTENTCPSGSQAKNLSVFICNYQSIRDSDQNFDPGINLLLIYGHKRVGLKKIVSTRTRHWFLLIMNLVNCERKLETPNERSKFLCLTLLIVIVLLPFNPPFCFF
jgi:hypothetical protein